jgi:hypothetical protein
MTTKQLIELLSQFDPESTVTVAYPASHPEFRIDTETIRVSELVRYDGVRPLISVNGALDLEG